MLFFSDLVDLIGTPGKICPFFKIVSCNKISISYFGPSRIKNENTFLKRFHFLSDFTSL